MIYYYLTISFNSKNIALLKLKFIRYFSIPFYRWNDKKTLYGESISNNWHHTHFLKTICTEFKNLFKFPIDSISNWNSYLLLTVKIWRIKNNFWIIFKKYILYIPLPYNLYILLYIHSKKLIRSIITSTSFHYIVTSRRNKT